jgi:LytR cell envelope-related transcriptional attenuator
MSDVADGSGPVPRRSPRTADGGAPVSGALAIVLAVVAVVAGFFILRSISGDDEKQFDLQSAGTGAAPDDEGDAAPSTTPVTSAPATAIPTTTTLVVDGATVVVANANGISGSAATMSDALEIGPGFTMGEPLDASDATGDLETTVIYFDPAQAAAQAVAESVNSALGGGATVLPLPSGTPPVASGDIGGAGVLVMLGLDKGNKTLEELNPTTNSSPQVVTNPPLTTAPPG